MPRTKICGLTSLDDARHAAELGAWALGMIFWPQSKRAVAFEEARRIGAALHRQAEIVGVFVDATLDEVERTAELTNLSMIQLHGSEGPQYCLEVKRRTGAKVIRATRVRASPDLVDAERYRVDYHLLDAYVPGEPGGTGQTFDWQLAADRRSTIPLILSGGLTPENVAGAIEQVRPFAVDVASGVESSPGVKDPEKVATFLQTAGARPKRPAHQERPVPAPAPRVA